MERYPWQWDEPYDPTSTGYGPRKENRSVTGLESPEITPGTGTQGNPPSVAYGPCNNGTGYMDASGNCIPYRTEEQNKQGGKTGQFESLPNAGLPYRPNYNFAPVPKFDAPEFSYSDKLDLPTFQFDEVFNAPQGASIYSDPSYQFRYDQGRKAAEQAAAARGISRTGGQWKAMQDYGQNFASQEYGNIYGRARDAYGTRLGAAKDIYDRQAAEKLGEFGTNYGVARDVFDRNYTGARDEYSPLLTEWQTLTAAEQRAADLELQNMWAEWMRNNPSWSEYSNALNQG